jgi:hypothetical protein
MSMKTVTIANRSLPLLLGDFLLYYCGANAANTYIFYQSLCHKAIHRPVIRYISLNITGKINPKPNIFTRARTQKFPVLCKFPALSSPKRANFAFATFFYRTYFSKLQKSSLLGLRFRAVFPCCATCSCHLFAVTNNFHFCVFLLS